jgi:2'-5' RNA ligase
VTKALRSEGRVRAFIAFPVDDLLREKLAALQAELAPGLPKLRLARPSECHVTLRFLGSVDPSLFGALEGSVRSAAESCPRGDARVAGLDLFPERGSPRVLVVGVELPPPMIAFQAACEAAAASLGLAPESRPFRPHLTLGRWKDRVRRPSLPDVDLGLLPLAEAVLFRSDLRPGGAVHSALARFPLAR